MHNIPSERTLSHMRWTEQRLRATPWVTWQEGLPYVGTRRLVLPETAEEVLLSEYHNVPPSIGYLSWFALLSAKYVGLRRKDVAHFLSLRKTQWLPKPQRSR